jgi:succinyl-CoA synthetase beta subunit
MNIHEYQGKAVLKNFGVTVSAGAAAFTVEEAITAAKSLPGPVYVVKSQIHAGGRGKAIQGIAGGRQGRGASREIGR